MALGPQTLPRLNIPERYRAPLSAIGGLPDESVTRIRALLDSATAPGAPGSPGEAAAPSDPAAIITAAKQSAAGTEISNARTIIDALATLYEVKSSREVSVGEFVEDICDAMEELDTRERLHHAERADYARKLGTLLSAEVFEVVAKAHDLATEEERTFCHARILTDLRPVFGPAVEGGPRAMVLVHTLKLAYHKQGSKNDHEEFYLALDGGDLATLRRMIDRAEAKAKSLASALKDVRLFGATKE